MKQFGLVSNYCCSFIAKTNKNFLFDSSAGWGTTSSEGDTSPVLLQTSLQTMPDICEKAYPHYNNVKQMCAGVYGGGRDACNGDSGAPLVYESNGQW